MFSRRRYGDVSLSCSGKLQDVHRRGNRSFRISQLEETLHLGRFLAPMRGRVSAAASPTKATNVSAIRASGNLVFPALVRTAPALESQERDTGRWPLASYAVLTRDESY